MIVIIQGPINNFNIADAIIKNINLFAKQNFIRSIIISTYENNFNNYIMSNIACNNLEIIIYNDPGSEIIEPTRSVPLNLDRQITTSSMPTSIEAKIDEPVMKIRNDLIVTEIGVWLIRNINSRWEILKSKVFVLPITTTRPCDLNYPALQVCDWFYLLNSQIYSQVFSVDSCSVSHESKISVDKSGRLSFGSENYITNKILSVMGVNNYSNMWDVDRKKWAMEFNNHFSVLPFLFAFRSIKYKRVYRNIISSPILSQVKSIYIIFFYKNK